MYYFLIANDCIDEFYLQVVSTIKETHMNLIFWNEDVDDWCVLETTLWAEDFAKIWSNPMRYQNYAKTQFIFDENTTYVSTW